MNKIYIDTRDYELKILENAIYLIEINTPESSLQISALENVKATVHLLIKESKVDIDIKLQASSSLEINLLASNSSINISSILLKDSNLKCVTSIISEKNSLNNLMINHQGSNSCSSFLANGINLAANKFFFTINGCISKDSKGVYLEENSKIININNGESKIIPNLIVDNEDVSANHAAFIGKFPDDVIWYLNSRGITKQAVYKFLTIATLLKGMNLDLETKEMFQEFILKNNKN